jgi:hypothetical protein
MSVSAILNGQGKVPPHYIDFTQPPFTTYVTNPMSSDLECYNPATSVNHAIKEASYVSAGEVKTDAVDLLPGSAATAVDVKTSLSLAANKQVRFADEVEVTAQGSNKVFFTTANGSNSFMGGSNAVEYAGATKVLTVNRPTVPPSPLLPGQGVEVNGSLTTVGAGVVSGADMLANGILISKGGVQPRTEYQDGTGTVQMETGWNSTNGRGVLRSAAFEAYSDGPTKKYLLNWGDNIGYLGLETRAVDTEIRHYNAGATSMETRMRVEGAGTVSIVGDASNGRITMGSTAPGAATSVEIASAGLFTSMFGDFQGAQLLNGLIKEVFGGPASGAFITRPIKLLGTLEVKNSGDETGPEHLQFSYNNSTDIGQVRVNTGAAKLVLEGQGGGVELKVPTVPQGDLILTGVPNVTTTTAHNVGLKATATGLAITKYLKVKLGAADIWIPYLTTDPSV